MSKTLKAGNVKVNVGHYLGGTHDGKTTGSLRAGSGGVEYRKDFTLGKHKKKAYTEQPNQVYVGDYGATSSFDVGTPGRAYLTLMSFMANALASLFYAKYIVVALAIPHVFYKLLVLAMFVAPIAYYGSLKFNIPRDEVAFRALHPFFGIIFVLYFILLLSIPFIMFL
jgi:hypothetical protein